MQHVFIVGAKSIGQYGGYETFVDKLTEYHQNNKKIKYHIACKANGQGYMDEKKLEKVTRINDSEFIYHNAHCFKLEVPDIGPAQAIYYDIKALKYCCHYITKNKIKHPIVYILACRIGPFILEYKKIIHDAGGILYVNPDGHEWKRAKWNALICKYWKVSERLMVKYADMLVCDSKNIEHYIHKEYSLYKPKTVYIAYGADLTMSMLKDNNKKYRRWLEKHGLVNGMFICIGRFVKENNFEIMIREFMKSSTKKDFVLITNINSKFLNEIRKKTRYDKDPRIKFVGTVYDKELLKKIRENAYAYFHGHEVGGTNPSLLEALASTQLNLLLDVGFNREVAGNAALYWDKTNNSLAKLVDTVDAMTLDEIAIYSERGKKRIEEAYSWQIIADKYQKLFGL